MISDNNGFDQEVIYYSNAIDYLREYDPSLRESLEIAAEYGFELTSLSSETLASLLKSRNVREEFNELQDEIDNFFTDLLEQEEENED
jgi:flagellar motility protein MotE (MotC chaperone)